MQYPLVFRFKTVMVGRGFQSAVQLRGRYLLEPEDGLWFALGVNPGGLSAEGSTPREAALAFRDGLRSALQTLAADSDGPADFDRRVKAFLLSTHPVANIWDSLRAEVRAGRLALEGVPVSRLENGAAQEAQSGGVVLAPVSNEDYEFQSAA